MAAFREAGVVSGTTAAPPRPPIPPNSPQWPPGRLPSEPPPDPKRRRFLWRVLAGCLVVVAFSAAVTVMFVKSEIGTLATDLSFHKAIAVSPHSLAPAGFGDPETILLIGNDQRKHTTTEPVLPHSNEMLLVRIDPSKPWISMMSIPRELQVTLQTSNGPVTTRLNAALIYGGMPLLLSTIKQLTGLSINHVVEIDFNQFKTAVDDIGCVYSTVDRRYYHVNTPDSEQYQEINLQPGYQKLCGTQALEFVSYRHGDTSLVRDSRDQDFLLDVKKEYGPSLADLGHIHKFERIFGRTVEVDRGLQTESGVENLLGTLISSESLRVRQVQFQVNLEPVGSNSCSCDTATPQQIAASVHSFLYGADKVPKQITAAAARAVHHRKVAAKLPLVAISTAGLAPARASARRLPFPLEYPRVQVAGGSGVPVGMRNYLIRGPDRSKYPAYVAVFSTGLLGQYYDVQGMTWTGAPMFANPDQTVTVAGRTYSLYYSGQHLMVVAWYEHGAVYWVHNSLTDAVGNGELLAIAEQTEPVGTPGKPGSPIGGGAASGHARLKAVVVPTRLGGAAQVSLAETIGSIGGLLTLIARHCSTSRSCAAAGRWPTSVPSCTRRWSCPRSSVPRLPTVGRCLPLLSARIRSPSGRLRPLTPDTSPRARSRAVFSDPVAGGSQSSGWLW
jgi:LCP family protein required for cell wall assembly